MAQYGTLARVSTLRLYQVQALRAISAAWAERDRTMIVVATGAGKTTIFSEVALRCKNAGRHRTLVLAHRKELITQAEARLRKSGLSVEVEMGERRASRMRLSDVVVASKDSMRGHRLAQWPEDAFDRIIVDECHHVVAVSYRAIVDRFPAAKTLGVTATADRGDGVALGGVIDHCCFEYDLRSAIDDGFLCRPVRFGIDMMTVDASSVRTTTQSHGRDFAPEDLAKMMRGEQPLLELARPIIKETVGIRNTIVFVPSVEIAHELARVLNGYLSEAGRPPAEALDGTSSKGPDGMREQALARYRRGETSVLVNCALFTEGFDAPMTGCVVVARPTKSRQLYAQMVGRGSRPLEEIADALSDPRLDAAQRRAIIAASKKPHFLIMELAPSNMKHQLVSAVDLLAGKDMPEAELKRARASASKEDVLAAVKKGEDGVRAAEERRARDKGRLLAEVSYRRIEVDPFDELGLDIEIGAVDGPEATAKQIARLDDAGFKLSRKPTRREASVIIEELVRRKARGLCSVKVMRVLARKGLEKNLSRDDARTAMDALVAAGWRVTPEIDERWGQRSAVDEAEDFDRSV